jgi:hypothetical protein
MAGMKRQRCLAPKAPDAEASRSDRSAITSRPRAIGAIPPRLVSGRLIGVLHHEPSGGEPEQGTLALWQLPLPDGSEREHGTRAAAPADTSDRAAIWQALLSSQSTTLH